MVQQLQERPDPGRTSSPPLKMTYEEFLQWADEDTWAEWVDGEVILLSPATERHQDLDGFLLALFRFFVDVYNLGVVFSIRKAARLNIGCSIPIANRHAFINWEPMAFIS